MVNILVTVGLLVISNIFMTFAWYAHLYDRRFVAMGAVGLIMAILFSWGLALFEYMFQVPANRLGSEMHGGSLSLFQLKILQEVITLTVFTIAAIFFFKSGRLSLNHFVAFVFLVLAVYFCFKK